MQRTLMSLVLINSLPSATSTSVQQGSRTTAFCFHHCARNRASCGELTLSLVPASAHAWKLTARGIFTEVGKRLQQRRVDDFVTNFGSHLTNEYKSDQDPALSDGECAAVVGLATGVSMYGRHA